MNGEGAIYASAQAEAERLNALLKPYAEQVVTALGTRGYPAYLEIGGGKSSGLGYSTSKSFVIHVPSLPPRFTRSGQTHYEYTIEEGVVKRHGNPGTTAATIISDAKLLTAGMRVPSKTATVPARQTAVTSSTGTSAQNVPDNRPSGETGPTTLAVDQESTPASGTIPTEPEYEGLAVELASVMDAGGFDTGATYNGYEWAHFYSRTQSSAGYVLGPSEMGLLEGQKVGIVDAAKRIEAYLASPGEKAMPAEDIPNGGAPSSGGSEAGRADWKTVALIGAMILAGVLLLRAI